MSILLSNANATNVSPDARCLDAHILVCARFCYSNPGRQIRRPESVDSDPKDSDPKCFYIAIFCYRQKAPKIISLRILHNLELL